MEGVYQKREEPSKIKPADDRAAVADVRIPYFAFPAECSTVTATRRHDVPYSDTVFHKVNRSLKAPESLTVICAVHQVDSCF